MKSILLTILASCCLLPAQAQNTTRNDSLMNRELTLEKEYNPTIQDVVKISQLPELREPQAPKSNVEFSNYATPYEVQSKLFPLDPQAYLTRLHYSKYKGYLTGGISSLIDINGDLGYQILNSDKDRLNIFVSHRSSSSDVSYLQDVSLWGETGTQKFKINDNWGGLNYMHDFSGIKFIADAKYTYSAFNYYGLSIYLSGVPNNFDKNTDQINNMFEAHIGISSEKDSELNYKLNIGYTNFRQKYGNTIDMSGSNENRMLIDGDIHKWVNSTMGIGVSGNIKTYSYGNEIFMSNYWTYSLNPYICLKEENFNLRLGAKMDVEVGGLKKIIASPDIRFNYYPNKNVMLYLLAEGGRKDNSQYDLYYENRYVYPFSRVMDSRSPMDAAAGIKFTPLSTLSAEIFGGYKITKDEHFYRSDIVFNNVSYYSPPMLTNIWIIPYYNDANTFKLGADFKYAYQNIFELRLKGTYYYYWIVSAYKYYYGMDLAWNKPDFEMNANATYRFPTLPLRFDLSYSGAYGRKTVDNSGFIKIVKMKDIHDLSLKATYSFTPWFSVYASANNLLFSKYDFWWGYPAQGFNIMGGLSFLF